MSQTPTPSELVEIRRVKAMVAGAGTTINPQCFLGPQGPTGPTGPVGPIGPAVTFSTLATPGAVLYYDANVGITGNSLFTFSSTLNANGQVTIQGDLVGGSASISSLNVNTISTSIINSEQGTFSSIYVDTILGATGNLINIQGDILAENASISSLNVNTFSTSIINVQQGIFSSINAETIFASTICTFTSVIFGTNTLIVQGLMYTSSLNLPNNLDSQFREITVNNGSLAINNATLAPQTSVFNTMFSLVYCNAFIFIPSSNPVGAFESDTNSFIVASNINSYANYFINSGQNFQNVTTACTMSNISRNFATGCNGLFGIMASCNYLDGVGYLSNQPLFYYTVNWLSSVPYLQAYAPSGSIFNFPFNTGVAFSKVYNPTDILSITVESLSPPISGYNGSAGFIRYNFYVNGSNVISNIMSNGTSNYTVPANQIPYFSLLISNLNSNDVYDNITFTGVNTWLSPNANIADTSIQPGLFSNQIIDATSTLIGGYEFISTASMNNSVFTLVWPALAQGTLSYNPGTNTLNAQGNIIFFNAGGKVTSLESYPNVFFSCVANVAPNNQNYQGLMDSTGTLRYYFTYDANSRLVFTIVQAQGGGYTTDIKPANSNDLLNISLTTQYDTYNNYSVRIQATVNASNIFVGGGYTVDNYGATPPPNFKAVFASMNDGESYSNIIFSGSYGLQNSNCNAYTSLASYPYQFTPILSNIQFIDNSNTANISQLSNYNSNLYFDGNLVGTDIFKGTFSSLLSSYSQNNGMFALVIPNSISNGTLVFNSATNSLYAAASVGNAGSNYTVTTVEAYNNIFFSCKANIDGGQTKFGIVDSNANFLHYFYNQGGSLYTNDGGSIKPWNSNDVLAISITNGGQYQTLQYYVNGSVIFTGTIVDCVYPSRAGFVYFNQGDSYTNIIFSGSFETMTNLDKTSVFLTAYPFTQSPIYSTIQLIDTANSANLLQLTNYQSTLYFNGSQVGGGGGISQESLTSSIVGLGSVGYISTGGGGGGSQNNGLFSLDIPPAISPGTILFNSFTNTLYAANNNQNQSDIVTSLEGYNSVFFTCKANISDTSILTRFGLVDSNNNFIHWFYNNSGYLYTNDGGTIKPWNSNDILAITITNFASSQAFNYYVNGSNAYSNISYDTTYPYHAGFTYFNQGDSYTDIVFSGSDDAITNPNTSVFLTAYPPKTASLNNGMFALEIPPAISLGTILLNSATNSLYAAFANQNQNDIVKSVEAYNNVFFTCKANISDTSQNTRIGIIDSCNSFTHYFYNNGGTLYATDAGSIKPWNSNDVLTISITNFGSNQTLNYYVNGSNAYSNSNYNNSYPYSAGFTYFNQGDSYTNIVFSGSYEIMTNSNTSVFLTDYPFTQSPIYSTLQLIDTDNSANILVLSNYQSNLYFNGLQVGGGISQEILTSSIQGLGSQGYVSSFDLASTVQGLGSQGYVSSFDLASTVQGLGSQGYISSFDLLTSTVQGLGSLGYVSTGGSLNNGMFSLVIPSPIYGNVILNSANNSLYAASNNQNQSDIVTSLEGYNSVFFTCKANISDTGSQTRFGLVDSNNNFIHYFFNNGGTLTAYDGGSVPIKPWNSNDALAISITNFASSQAVNYYVNGSNAYSNISYDTTYPYSAGFTYFNQGDSYTNIVFSGSYEIMTNSNTSVFLTDYPFTQSPIYSTLQLIDTNNSASILELSNYQSVLYFNGTPIGGGGGIQTTDLVSSIEGLGSSGYLSSPYISISSIGVASTINFNDIANNITYNNITISTNTGITTISYNNNPELYNSNTALYFNNKPLAAGAITENFMVAGGMGTNTLAYSYDGMNWVPAATNGGITQYASSAAWNGSLWVATGYTSGNTCAFAYSYDGINWSSASATASITGIVRTSAWNGSLWVAGGATTGSTGALDYSYDGINWFAAANTGGITSIVYAIVWNGSLWVAGGEGTNVLAYSYDGINWFPAANDGGITLLVISVAWNGSLWVAGGTTGSAGALAYSYDGINWFAATNDGGITVTVYSIAWNGSLWVAGGYISGPGGALAYSYDGITWFPASINGNTTFVFSVVWNGSLWVAGGLGSGVGALGYSYDGINWYPLATNGGITNGIYGMASRRVLPYVGSSPVSASLAPITSTTTLKFVDLVNTSAISSLYNSNGSLYFGSNQLGSVGESVSSIEGLGSSGYISSLSNLTVVSSLLGSFSSINVNTIVTSSFITNQAVPARIGNVLTVDQVYGNDSTASIGGLPYLTVNAAVAAAASGGGIYTISIMPGTYELSAGITIPTGCSIRGKSTQTTTIQMTGVTSSTTLITHSIQTRIEDVTLILSSATASTNLVGVYFPDGTTTNCKIRGCTITVSSTATDSSTVYGIFADGTTTNPTIQLSSNAVQRTTVNVTSSTTGAVRGCYFTGALQFIIRDATIFATGTGSAIDVIGVECTNTGAYISIQTSTVCGRPISSPETVHDIKQPSLPLGSLPVVYLNAVNLVNADTGSNGFGVNTEPNQLIYVLQGQNGGGGGLGVGNYYLLPGRTEPADLVQNPTAGFFSIPFAQRALVFSANISYEGANFNAGSQLFVNIRKTTSRNLIGSTIASAVLSNGQFGPCNLQNFSATFDPTVPNYLQVQLSTTGANSIPSNHSNALYVSLCSL